MRPRTSPVVNIVGASQQFTPLPSGLVSPEKLNYVEEFGARAAPEVLSRTVPIVGAAAPFLPLTPVEITRVLGITLPVPMPIAVTLGAYATDFGPLNNRFRSAARFSAEAESDTVVRARGRYIIEWGYGKARNYAFTDLAPGSLQIPIADSLTVSAHVFGDNAGFVPGAVFCFAGASAYPGSVTKTPAATFTQHAVSQALNPFTASHIVPPFAKRWSAGFVGSVLDAARMTVFLNSIDAGTTLGAWDIPAAPLFGFAGTPPAAHPYGTEDVLLPGGANTIGIQMYGTVQTAPFQGYVMELIQL